MYDIKEETNAKTMAEVLRLGQMHYEEIYAHKKDLVPRNYNWQFLKMCLDNGLMHIVTARDEDGKLVGHFANLISPDMFSSTFQAKDLAIFVHPDHRKAGVMTMLITEMERLLRINNVTSQVLAFQVGFNDQLPLKYGYRHTENVFEKILIEV